MAFGDPEMSLTLDSSLMNTDKDESEVVSLEETGDVEQETLELQDIVAYVKSKYNKAKDKRQSDERRWLDCYDNYRGNYSHNDKFTEEERSQVFVKITKTKVHAAFAQICDVLFSAGKFPISVEQTPVPVGIEDAVHFDPNNKEQSEEEPKDENQPSISATVARPNILQLVGKTLATSLKRVEDKLKVGPGLTQTAFTWEPAKEAAKKMEKILQDQFEESDASKSLRSTVFEMCLFGHGVYKGPTAKIKEYSRWTEDGSYDPITQTVPDYQYVSIWDCYPDPDARNIAECEYFIQRHKMSASDLRKLKKRPYFRSESINLAISDGPAYVDEYWEDHLKDQEMEVGTTRYEVLEFWGVADKKMIEESGLEIPKDFKDMDEIQVNIWTCNNRLLRVVLNPFTPARLPYHSCPYEHNPYSFFGIGVAENMLDTQMLMNGFMRMAVDNAAYSANIVFEIDETNLIPGQDYKIYPGKIFRRQGGQPGTSVNSIKFDNVTQELMLLFDKARQQADEATGIPSYSHGQTGIMNTGRTAAGMSMLMGASAQNIKSVVRNIDDYLLGPMGKAGFAFNMQFNFDKEFVGDLDVVAKGTESLMRNEVRSQKLMQFYQMTANPQDAVWTKRGYILREIAKTLDLEPDKVVNDEREAAIQAAAQANLNQTLGQEPEGQPSQGGPPGLDDPTGTGNGNIGPGQAPEPGAAGFTGAGGGANGGQVVPQSPAGQGMMPGG